ncbi:DUF1183-domain-containing protein [Rhizopogon vinicolor AM-OR11-026]|uniref:Store-operated calcium entry-associated regulatory factor n=1 Tax=Rhizopogon vinicolor AM-OR11-026 TaxID=1314800 RepID=A0A1B7MSU6_9AGAM|nr:DUF1183-domain-containing protein [Rhizopogon vinicolor AM-OR11-026]
MSRVALESIPSLTFYKDALTAARRTNPISQLVCVGKPCALYQPDVVHCKNIGGSGTDVDWKCEADLPSSLRFGRVEVSCEGWNGHGDLYVMKGSCSLEYNLVQIPDSLRDDSSWSHSYNVPWFSNLDNSGIFFMVVWIIVLAFILFSFIKPFLHRDAASDTRTAPRTSPPSYPGGGPGGLGGFPGSSYSSPPPPYTKDASSAAPSDGTQWRPGFWTGAALGALGNHLLNRSPSRPGEYDWERERRSPFGSSRARPVNSYDSQDRGEGPSNLGAMRTSTGYGGSSSR